MIEKITVSSLKSENLIDTWTLSTKNVWHVLWLYPLQTFLLRLLDLMWLKHELKITTGFFFILIDYSKDGVVKETHRPEEGRRTHESNHQQTYLGWMKKMT